MITIKDIREKLMVDPEDGAAYAELGDHYCPTNINQAYLCYEHAYHRSNEAAKEALKAKMEACKKSEDFRVNPVAVVILSYNSKAIMQECLNAIRNTCDDGTYEVVVIDSASTDGVREWLLEQKDIKLALNDKFLGFAAGCNQGAKMAEALYDIMLLNNDAIVTPHSVFYLRLGLYANNRIGAVGPVSNNVIIEQKHSFEEHSKGEWLTIAREINTPSKHYAQYSHWLQGHALLIKRRVWDVIGGLDTNFGFGGYEDDEYGFRMNANGYLMVCCHNSFVFHYGSISVRTKPIEYEMSLNKNVDYLNKKWGFGFYWKNYNRTEYEFLDAIKEKETAAFSVLEIGGGFSNILNIIKYQYPNSDVHAIELNERVARIAATYVDMVCGDIETMEIPYELEKFDYILMANVLEYLRNPFVALKRIKSFLKKNGHIIIRSPNANHIKVISEIIHGRFNSANGDTLDHAHALHFFTMNDLTQIIKDAGYVPEMWMFKYSSDFANRSPEEEALLNAITSLPGAKNRNDYLFTGSMIVAKKA